MAKRTRQTGSSAQAASFLPNLPEEIVDHCISLVSHTNVEVLHAWTCTSHRAIAILKPQLALLFNLVDQVAMHIYSPLNHKLRYHNPTIMLGHMPNNINCQYSRGLALFLQSNPNHCSFLLQLDLSSFFQDKHQQQKPQICEVEQ